MTGVVDHAHAEPLPHYCRPPEIERFEENEEARHNHEFGFPWVRYIDHPKGTRFTCECGIVWVVCWRETVVGATAVHMGGWEWREETRKQRRERLGLRWWQRERSR